MPRSRTDFTGVMWTPSISILVDGSWCWRRLVAHHRTSVLSELSCSLFDFIQVAMSSAHSVTCDESASTAAGGHEQYTVPAYHRRKDAATDHGVQSARSAPRCTRRTELVPAQNPEAHRKWGKRWLIAQTRGVRTDAGRTGRTETIDEHCHQCQKLSAAAVARSTGRPCQRPLINPEGSGRLYHHGGQASIFRPICPINKQRYNIDE